METPSKKTASVVCLARMLTIENEAEGEKSIAELEERAMTPELRFYSGYILSQLYPVMQRMAKLLSRARKSKFRVMLHVVILRLANSILVV